MKIKSLIKTYSDFPSKGIEFKDITPILSNSKAFQNTIFELVNLGQAYYPFEFIACMESRGFYFGCPMAHCVGSRIIPIRKQDKLPGSTWKQFCGLEYGECYLEIQKNVIKLGDKVLIVDDILATGGTALASAKLIEQAGGKVAGFLFVGEITKLKGRNKLSNYSVKSLVKL